MDFLSKNCPKKHLFCFCFCFCFVSRAAPTAYESSQAQSQIGVAPAGLHHSHMGSEASSATCTTAHGNTRSLSTEQGQGLNPCPHGCWLSSLALSHDGNSEEKLPKQDLQAGKPGLKGGGGRTLKGRCGTYRSLGTDKTSY